MSLTRREFLTLSGLAAASAALAACAPAHAWIGGEPALVAWHAENDATWRALSRLTFAPRPDERARADEIGVDVWIEEQLAPQTIADTDCDLRVRGLNTLTMDTSLLFAVREENARRELEQAALLRAIYSRRQLYEIMVDFWSDHFSLSTQKTDCGWLKTVDDRAVIRPHALGNFRDLLWASMHSPAMLKYLDNQENHKGKPNENYARELMELHTLGVDAGYAQRDVQQVAHCLTGWSVDDRLYRGRFRFDASQHDDGEKIVLGQNIPAGGGERDGERVFELLMAHPALPRFIARKLVRRFVADDPPMPLVHSAAATFTRSNGDLKAMLSTILHSDDFRAAPPKLKRPLNYVAGALRQLNAETDGGEPLLHFLRTMGQPLFQWPTPDGFPDYTAAWNGSLVARWQFALALALGSIKGTHVDFQSLARTSGVEGTKTLDVAFDRFAILLRGAPLPRADVDALLNLFGRHLDDEGLQVAMAVLMAAPQYHWR